MTRPTALETLAGTVLLACACIQIGGTQERRLVTLDGIPKDTATTLAQGYATGPQLDRLRQAAKAKFPGLTDADLQSLTLRRLLMAMQDGQHVMLEVTFMPKQAGVDARAVADYIGETVRKDVRAMLVRSGAQ
jgi:hypothetical protein